MTDDEIIKSLEELLPYIRLNSKHTIVINNTIILINRQKTEIETLKAERNNYKEWYLSLANEVNKLPCKTVVGNNSEIHSKSAEDYDNLITNIKSEAIQDFVDLLVDKIVNTQSVFSDQEITHDFLSGNAHRQHEILDYIDNLVKEMTEEKENA